MKLFPEGRTTPEQTVCRRRITAPVFDVDPKMIAPKYQLLNETKRSARTTRNGKMIKNIKTNNNGPGRFRAPGKTKKPKSLSGRSRARTSTPIQWTHYTCNLIKGQDITPLKAATKGKDVSNG